MSDDLLPANVVSRLPAGLRQREWSPVSTGHSGAVVLGAPGLYVKAAAHEHANELLAEVDRLVWLSQQGPLGPDVVELIQGDLTVLVTTEVPGIPACDVAPVDVPRAVDGIAAALRALHAVSIDACPFVRGVDEVLDECQQAVAAGVTDAPGRSSAQALEELAAVAPRARASESVDRVVAHCDACLPNIVLDPATFEPNGFVDVGRLGVADRHADLALITRSMASSTMNPQYDERAATRLLELMGGADEWRLWFYRAADSLC